MLTPHWWLLSFVTGLEAQGRFSSTFLPRIIYSPKGVLLFTHLRSLPSLPLGGSGRILALGGPLNLFCCGMLRGHRTDLALPRIPRFRMHRSQAWIEGHVPELDIREHGGPVFGSSRFLRDATRLQHGLALLLARDSFAWHLFTARGQISPCFFHCRW